jgi:hypothetical protein
MLRRYDEPDKIIFITFTTYNFQPTIAKTPAYDAVLPHKLLLHGCVTDIPFSPFGDFQGQYLTSDFFAFCNKR